MRAAVWNHDISSAPQDKPVWLATKCGKVTKSAWIDGKGAPGRWAGLASREAPIAWQPFIVPEHPGNSVIVHRHTEINLPIIEDVGGV